MTTENQTQFAAAPQPPALGGEPAVWCAPVPLAGCSKAYDQGFADGCSESQRLNEPTVARLQAEVERESAERQTYVEATQRACKVIGQLRGLLREWRHGSGQTLKQCAELIEKTDAALVGGKEHE